MPPITIGGAGTANSLESPLLNFYPSAFLRFAGAGGTPRERQQRVALITLKVRLAAAPARLGVLTSRPPIGRACSIRATNHLD